MCLEGFQKLLKNGNWIDEIWIEKKKKKNRAANWMEFWTSKVWFLWDREYMPFFGVFLLHTILVFFEQTKKKKIIIFAAQKLLLMISAYD